jgi:hypothetical protein
VEKIDWVKLVKKMLLWQWAVITAGLTIGAGIWITISSHLPPQIPIFYSRPWGEEQLAEKYFLWLPLIITVFTAIVVTFVVKKLKLESVLAVMLTGAAIISEIILILAMLRTVILVS